MEFQNYFTILNTMVFKKYKKNTLKQSVIKFILNMLTTNDSYSLIENNL